MSEFNLEALKLFLDATGSLPSDRGDWTAVDDLANFIRDGRIPNRISFPTECPPATAGENPNVVQ